MWKRALTHSQPLDAPPRSGASGASGCMTSCSGRDAVDGSRWQQTGASNSSPPVVSKELVQAQKDQRVQVR